MTNVNGLLENLVTALGTNEAPALQAKAAHAICNLASNRTSFSIVDLFGLLPALVAGLNNSENQELQTNSAVTNSAVALSIMASGGLGTKMIDNFPKIVDVLVDEVSKGGSRDDDRDNVALQYGMLTLTVLSLERAKEIQLGSTKVLLGRAVGELWWGLHKESIEDFSRWEENLSGTLAEHPDASAALSNKCCAKAKLGDLQGALADANRAVDMECIQIASQERKMAQFDAFARKERGVVKRRMGDYAGALADFDASLHLYGDDYYGLKHRGFVKFLLKDEDGARADAERALTCKPSRVEDEDYGRLFLVGESLRYLDFELR